MPDVLNAADLKAPPAPALTELRPPPRFKTVTFAAYQPQDQSQHAASGRIREFVESRPWSQRSQRAAKPARRSVATGRGGQGGASWLRALTQPRAHAAGARRRQGLYLDGGFGVGKTHLLASAFAEADTPDKRYLGFQDLVYLIGVLGRERAQTELAGCDLLCIEEFELDDPGNTLIVKSFLAAHFQAGGTALTTSNTPPDAQGRGRFNAEDFQREIQSVADNFELIAIGGPDYRHRGALASWLSDDDLEALLAPGALPGRKLLLTFSELGELLAGVHPSRYAGLLGQADAVLIRGVATIRGQNEALRFVHFVDKLYDLGLGLAATGDCALPELFHADYRHSAYHKKHERCLSRLSELLVESAARLGEAGAAGGLGEQRRVATA